MNIIKKVISFIIVLLAITALSCHDEEEVEKEYIKEIKFNVKEAKMTVGQELSVQVEVSPSGAVGNETIAYSMSQDGYVELKNGTNSGIVMKALMSGSVVLIAKARDVTGYLEVKIEGGEYIGQPYIMVSDPVVEIKEGESRVISVNLYNGSVLDNYAFEWIPEAGKENINVSVTANTAVIKGLVKGNQKIKIRHPRAEGYDVDVLIFVSRSNEYIKYIYCEQNVILLETAGQYKSLEVSLHGGSAADNADFRYEKTEGADLVDIIPNNGILNLRALKPGTAKIKVEHPQAEVPFEITAICVSGNVPLITLDRSFVILETGRGVLINAGIENPQSVTALSEFSFEYAENAQMVVSVQQSNNEFFVQALNNGLAKIKIKNAQAQYERELLIFVRSEAAYRDDYYITTSQNVIQTQVGGEIVYLNMLLVGGNSADANSFEWLVSDGTVIDVESSHGEVKYNIYEARSAASVNEAFVAAAVITPKRIGTSTITVSHPKSESAASVLVKVYPKNTFEGTPVIVKTEGLIKVLLNSEKLVTLEMVSGKTDEVGSINWEIEDENIARVTNNHSLSNVISGKSSGRTKLKVSGGNLKQNHESIVLAGTQAELDMARIIYVDSVYQTVAKGQVARIEVKNSKNENLTGYKLNVRDTNILYAVMVENQLVLQGKEPGETTVKITNPQGQEEGVTIYVAVTPVGLSLDKPYYISGPEIVGVANGVQKGITVNLAGAPAHVKGDIKWTVEEAGVISIIENGEEAVITGASIDKQTRIKVTHPKSENEKTIIVYTAVTEADLNNKIVIGVEKNNYLMTRGEELFISLKTNANDVKKSEISWGLSDYSVLSVESNYDSAKIKSIGAGNAKLTISHPDNVIPVVIYFSVVEARADEKMISGPATIEILIGESRIITLNTRNLGSTEKENIRWETENENIASLRENGESAYILGLEKGVTYVNISQSQLGYRHRAALLCARTKEELASMYIMGVSDTYNRMTVGEEKKIKLEFGSNGFPEAEKAKIIWTASSDNVIRVTGNGKGESVTIVAQAEGAGYVDVRSDVAENKTLRINFEVSGKSGVNRNLEFGGFEKIKGIVIGQTEIITLKIYENGEEIKSGYALMKPVENEKDAVCQVTQVDNVLNIKAVGIGQSVITAEHPQVMEKARILVYTAATQAELDSMYPLAAEKKNFLIQVGESAEVRLITEEGKDAQNMDKITWGMTESGVVDNPVFSGKKNAVFKGKKAGRTEILIGYPNSNTIVEKVYISVVEKTSNIDFSKNIMTENIIGMYPGQTRETSVMLKGFSSSEEGELKWETSNSGTVTVVGNGRSAVIKVNENAALNTECYVTVSYGTWLKRHILVYVTGQENVADYKAMNMENQYIRIARNETVILPVYYAPKKSGAETIWQDRYENGVAEIAVKDSGAKAEITGKEEGVAVYELSNNGKTNIFTKITLYVEVSNNYINMGQNNTQNNTEEKYLTAGRTVYLLNPDEVGKQVEMTVSAIGMTQSEIQEIKWTQDNNKIRMFPAGDSCIVMANSAEGETVIKASHPAANIVEIKVIISRQAVIEGVSYIDFEDVVKLGYGEIKNLNVIVGGVVNYNPNYFTVSCDKSNAEVTVTGGIITLKGVSPGQAKIKIEHRDAVIYKETIVVVTAAADGLIYLTTKDNFNVIKAGEVKTVAAELIGYEDGISANYTWKVEEGSEGIVSVRGNGKTAVIEANNAGIGKTAKISVTHYFSDFPLYIYARVSALDIPSVYITTAQNIITFKENSSYNLEVELVNGDGGDYSRFGWSTQNTDIVNLYGAGNSALVQGKKPGAARITVSNPSCLNTIDIIAIIEPDLSDSGIYITTDNLLIDMKPNDPVKTVTARLVGGNQEDIYGFKWEMYTYDSVERYTDGTSKIVIDITAGADKAYVQAKNEGEAVIRVTHPKTSYRLDIKIDVKYDSKIEFTQRTVNVPMGDTVLVSVNAPTNQRVIYESSNTGLAVVSGTNKMCVIEGIRNGPVVITARNVKGDLSDEIIAQVTYVNTDYGGIIKTTGNYLVLNMNDVAGIEVSAELSGRDKNGNNFLAGDEDNIEWQVQGNDSCISFSKVKNGNSKIGIGGSVFIKPVKAGEVEIHLKHPKLKDGYVKRYYVKVEVNEAVFYLDKTMIIMGKKMTERISCTISNVPDVNWSNDVVWKINSPEKIILVATQEEGRVIIIQSTGVTGSSTIEATYKGVVTRTVSILVEEVKMLEIPAAVSLLKGETRKIKYAVSPADEVVQYTLSMDGIVNIKGLGTEGNGDRYIEMTGMIEGQVVLTMRMETTGLVRTMAVTTMNTTAFYFINSESVRMKPGETREVFYEVNDLRKNNVEVLYQGGIYNLFGSNNNFSSSNFTSNVGINLDKENKKVIITSKGIDGYFKLVLRDTAGEINIEPKEVFIYYEKMEPEINITSREESLPYHSTMSGDKNAIYLADGAKINMQINISQGKYPGGTLKLKTQVLEKQWSLSETLNISVINSENGTFWISCAGKGNKADGGTDVLLNQNYYGLLKLTYECYTGNWNKTVIESSYLVYVETWKRK
jgi:hypothetical protein